MREGMPDRGMTDRYFRARELTMNPLKYLDLMGKEFEYGARGPEKYDCYGLMIEMRRRAGLPMPESYSSTSMPEVMHDSIEHAKAVFPFRELPEPRPFCLVTFRLHPRYTTHIGMVLGDCYRFIHILPKLRVAVERLDSPCWSHRVTGFWETCRTTANSLTPLS
jgi:murein DD-endopeptidase